MEADNICLGIAEDADEASSMRIPNQFREFVFMVSVALVVWNAARTSGRHAHSSTPD